LLILRPVSIPIVVVMCREVTRLDIEGVRAI
jgi:hypothetical protein